MSQYSAISKYFFFKSRIAKKQKAIKLLYFSVLQSNCIQLCILKFKVNNRLLVIFIFFLNRWHAFLGKRKFIFLLCVINRKSMTLCAKELGGIYKKVNTRQRLKKKIEITLTSPAAENRT